MFGEPDGFRDYVVARRRALLRTARVLADDQQAAEDLVQTALERVWPRWEGLARAGDPDAYVRKVMFNAYISSRRRHWYREEAVEHVAESPMTVDDYAAVDLRDALRRLLPTLTPRQRAVVVLRFHEDLSETTTAEVMGCSVGTVKSQTAKALARLRVLPDPRISENER